MYRVESKVGILLYSVLLLFQANRYEAQRKKSNKEESVRCSKLCVGLRNMNSNNIDKASLIIFPTLFLVYNIGYWFFFVGILYDDEIELKSKCTY